MTLIQALRSDARRLNQKNVGLPSLLRLVVTNAPFASALLFRLSSALRDSNPSLARLVAKTNLILHGIDIDYRATIGPGVLFAHPVGVVIGGDCVIGREATFMSGVVLGRKDALAGPDKGMYPRIGSGVFFGTGSTVLGPVTVGDNTRVGAQALLLTSTEPNSLAFGSPARPRPVELTKQ